MNLPARHQLPVLAIVLVTCLVAATPVLAARVTVTPRLAAPGTDVQIEASGFGAGERIDAAFGALPAGTLTAGPSGSVSTTIEVPDVLAPGLTEVRLTGVQSGVVTTPFRARTNWAQLGQTAEHGFANGSENVLSPGTVAGLTRLWRVPVGDGASPVRGGPVVASGRVYVGSEDGSVRAYGAISGRERWRRAVGAPIRTTPAAAYRLLFVTSGDRLLALDSATGTVAWKRTLGPELGSPAVSDFGVFVQDVNGTLHGLHAIDGSGGVKAGTELWPARPLGATGGRPRTPTVDDDRILTIVDGGASGDALVVLDSATGTERRRVPLWPAVAIGGSASPAAFDAADPVTARGGNATVTIVAPGDVTRLQSLATFSARTGDLLGTGKLDGGRTFSTAVALPGTARIGGTTEGVASLGSWVTATPVPATPALVAGGVAFAGAADGVRALSSETGAVLWTSSGTSAVEAPPAVADGRVYVSSAAGYVDAFALASPPSAGTAAGAVRPSSGPGAVRLRVTAVSPQRALRTRRITLRVSCRPACRVTADGTALVVGRGAAAAPTGSRTAPWTRVPAVRRNAAEGRTVVVRLPLGARQRKAIAGALQRGRRVRVRVRVQGSAAGLATATVLKRVSVRR